MRGHYRMGDTSVCEDAFVWGQTPREPALSEAEGSRPARSAAACLALSRRNMIFGHRRSGEDLGDAAL